jgi:hypothetical protein
MLVMGCRLLSWNGEISKELVCSLYDYTTTDISSHDIRIENQRQEYKIVAPLYLSALQDEDSVGGFLMGRLLATQHRLIGKMAWKFLDAMMCHRRWRA